MTLLTDLLTALPVGVAEAAAAQGLDSMIGALRRSPDVDERLADDLAAIAAEREPSRPIAVIAEELTNVGDLILTNKTHHGAAISQHAGDESSQFAVGEVGRDLYVQNPPQPRRP